MSLSDQTFELSLRNFFEPLKALLNDASVSEVLVNSWNDVYVERDGALRRTNAAFASEFDLEAALTNLAQSVGRTLDSEHPLLEAKLPDGSRVQAIVPPVSLGGPCVAIRRVTPEGMSLASFVDSDPEGEQLSSLLREIVAGRRNTIICGGSASGKTSLLRVLISLMAPTERVITVERVPELKLSSRHTIQLQAVEETGDPADRTTLRELVRATLRMRPDRIVVGELRGGEACEVIGAMSSGFSGCAATLNSMSPEDALISLETLVVQESPGISRAGLAQRIASAVDTIVQVARFRDGRCRVVRLSEVRGWSEGCSYQLNDRFRSDSC